MKAPTQSRRQFLKTLSALAVSAAMPRISRAAASSRPNVIIVLTDDQGYGDLGATGNPIIKTPNIDAMTSRSGCMTNFYVSPVCAPTRACLMTGRYNYRTRVVDTWIGRAMMEPAETTVAEILRDAGYETGIFGKWHLGDCYPMRPMDQGFTESLVLRGGGIGQPADPPGGEGKYTDPVLLDNGALKPFKGYCTDVYFDRAMSWMDRCNAAGRPFFAYIPTNAPHGPFHDVPEELLAEYKKLDLSDDRFPQDKGHPLGNADNLDNRARIYAMITNIDQNMGRLFEKLDRLNITDNTVVMFLVDNGPNGRRYVAGFKGFKSHVHEGGIHSPLYVQWPAAIKPGRTSDRIAAHIDLLPTVLQACKVPVPAGLKLDGRSILPLLTSEETAWPDRMIVIQSHRGDVPVLYHNFAARTQQWKLLNASGFGREELPGEPKFELYDMQADPLEMKNLAAARPEKLAEMKTRYEQWFRDVSSTRPDNYSPPRIHIGSEHENPTTLTRQDWRHFEGRPWAGDSNGFWLLHAEKSGKYDIAMIFPALPADAAITLNISGRETRAPLDKGAAEYTFESVRIYKGDLRLIATIADEDKARGPYQIDVFSR